MSTLTELAGTLAEVDPAVAASIAREEERQRTTLELIASENFASRAVIEAVGTVLTNKYAEGYPGRRYYGGCDFVDEVETLAIERAKELFAVEHANVQPHSGAQANMAVYFGLLKPGDTVMGMRLDQGGHLTHGSNVNFSGKLFEFVSYGVDRETRDDRLRRDGGTRPRAPPEDHRRRRDRLPPGHRLRAGARDRRRGRGAAHGGHGAHRRPRCLGRASDPGRPRAADHELDAQDAAWPARRASSSATSSTRAASTAGSSRTRRVAR